MPEPAKRRRVPQRQTGDFHRLASQLGRRDAPWCQRYAPACVPAALRPFAEAVRRSGGVVSLEGATGSGKTTLAVIAVLAADRPGFWATAQELCPFALAALRSRRHVVILDDVELASRASAAALKTLRSAAATVVLLAGPAPRHAAAQALWRCATQRFRVPRRPASAVRALVAQATGVELEHAVDDDVRAAFCAAELRHRGSRDAGLYGESAQAQLRRELRRPPREREAAGLLPQLHQHAYAQLSRTPDGLRRAEVVADMLSCDDLAHAWTCGETAMFAAAA
jgi:hypothetical protein